MEIIQTIKAPQAIGPYSQAIKKGGFVFTSGQIALKPDGNMVEGGVEEQAFQVLRNLQEVLKAAGCSFSNVVKTTIYLKNIEDFQKVNAVYESFFASFKPARSTVAVKELPKNALVEIDAIALL
jgi:2-iminobutanoate/2-iminopropanoate deaminase